MAQSSRRKAAAKPAAADEQNSRTAGDGTANDQDAGPDNPPADPETPEVPGGEAAQAPTAQASADAGAEQPEGDGAPSPVSGGDEDKGANPNLADAPSFEFFVRTKGKRPRRRSGIAFGPEAVLITQAAFARNVDGAKALLAIFEDPALSCFLIDEDGKEQPMVSSEELEMFRAAIASGAIPSSEPDENPA